MRRWTYSCHCALYAPVSECERKREKSETRLYFSFSSIFPYVSVCVWERENEREYVHLFSVWERERERERRVRRGCISRSPVYSPVEISIVLFHRKKQVCVCERERTRESMYTYLVCERERLREREMSKMKLNFSWSSVYAYVSMCLRLCERERERERETNEMKQYFSLSSEYACVSVCMRERYGWDQTAGHYPLQSGKSMPEVAGFLLQKSH